MNPLNSIYKQKIRIRYTKKKEIITPNGAQLKNIGTKHGCSFVYYFFFAWV